MSRRDDGVSLGDMLSHAQEAIELLGEMSREALARDRVIQLALARLMEIVGEAANRLSSATQESYPGIPWAQVISMRNRLIHGYDVIVFNDN